MFDTLEHKFGTLEHKFDTLEHKFETSGRTHQNAFASKSFDR